MNNVSKVFILSLTDKQNESELQPKYFTEYDKAAIEKKDRESAGFKVNIVTFRK
jgi:hypothetical protein